MFSGSEHLKKGHSVQNRIEKYFIHPPVGEIQEKNHTIFIRFFAAVGILQISFCGNTIVLFRNEFLLELTFGLRYFPAVTHCLQQWETWRWPILVNSLCSCVCALCEASSSSLAFSVENNKMMLSTCTCAAELDLTDKLVHCWNG